MKFAFEVGEKERHRVTFNFPFLGNLVRIRVDGHPVVTDFRFLSFDQVQKYEFAVGDSERHEVVIEKERKLWFAGCLKQKYRVLVDGNLVQEHEGF